MSSQAEDQGTQPTSVGVECVLSRGPRIRHVQQCHPHGSREIGASLRGREGRQTESGRRIAESRGSGTPEVGRGRSTEEVGEDEGNARRDDGGKDRGQGKICCTKRVLDTGRGRRDHVPAADREASERGNQGEVHQSAEPREGAAAARGTQEPAQGCSTGNRRGDVGRVRRADRRAAARPAGPNPTGQLPRATRAAGAHPERRWAHATARDTDAGGQGRPAGGADGGGANLRGDVPGLFVWISRQAESAPSP